ncbi:MAG TPA: response regulator [Nitrospirota bacterium]
MAASGVNEENDRTLERRNGFALLVDGYMRDLFSTGIILQRLQYDVYIVSSAEDALRIIDAAAPAMLITELALPQMSGLELLVRVKHDPAMKAIPVIVLTGTDDANREKLCIASGCACYLKKPIEPDTLYTAIQRVTEIMPRQYMRLRIMLPARVSGAAAGEAMSTEYVSEVSENGLFICTLNPRPVNTILTVTVMIHSIPIRAKAMVLRCVTIDRERFTEPGMGMKFVEISRTDRELIRNFIKGHIIKDMPIQ